MTYTPIRPLQSRNRSRIQRRSTSPITPPADAAAKEMLQTTVTQPRKRGRFSALSYAADKFVSGTSGNMVRFVVRRSKIKTKQSVPGVSWKVAQLINKAVEEKLAERLERPSQAVATARERGAAWKRVEYASPENLSLDQASQHAVLSARVINERRNDGRYYALLAEGQTRGFRFPRWQFDVPEQRLQPVLAIARAAGASAWGIHVFMISPSSLLDGKAPRDWIGDATQQLERLIRLTRNRFYGDQGAGCSLRQEVVRCRRQGSPIVKFRS